MSLFSSRSVCLSNPFQLTLSCRLPKRNPYGRKYKHLILIYLIQHSRQIPKVWVNNKVNYARSKATDVYFIQQYALTPFAQRTLQKDVSETSTEQRDAILIKFYLHQETSRSRLLSYIQGSNFEVTSPLLSVHHFFFVLVLPRRLAKKRPCRLISMINGLARFFLSVLPQRPVRRGRRATSPEPGIPPLD